ncbi:hypothetical protein [Methylophilus sp. 5]|uniref:hypothetical protein n=1 Tax=Methylophilus sp. 5 TaxID=1112274 RepID=UPI00048AC383|nr:hypothetical protein [Methylophilus sp. 5]
MTEIEQKYQALGGEQGLLGRAVSSEQATPSGLGSFQDFEHGMIFYHPDFGAHVLSAQVETKWKSAMLANDIVTGTQQAIRDYIGFPISDTTRTGEQGELCYFERGMIVVRPGGQAWVIYGEIYLAYRMQADVQGFVGFPRSDVQPSDAGGLRASFDGADLFWHPSTGAFEVHGDILQKYRALGATQSLLGYPISDETSLFKGTQQIGRASQFQFGTIYWSAETGAFEMHGDLLKAYQAQHQGPAGPLGFPISDETRSPNDVCRFHNFQHGILVWQAANRQVSLVTHLKLVVTRLETDEDNDDLMVRTQVVMDHLHGQQKVFEKQFGEYSNQGTKTFANPEQGFVCDCPVNDGNVIVTVNMQAYDIDGGFNGADDLIAQFNKSFGIETLWDSSFSDLQGNNLSTFYNGPDGKFRASFTIFTDHVLVDPTNSDHFRQNLFWSFKNPKIAKLSFETCAATFSDLEADDSWIFHPFNRAFYETVYKGAAKTGTCFGMCLEAIYALKGVSSSRPFISQYAFDAQRTQDISVKFGYQLGGSQVSYMIEHIKNGRMWNPVQNFEFSKQRFDQQDYCLLCLSEGVSPEGGHAVLPYRWEKVSDTEWRIYVANPNSPAPKTTSNEGGDRVIIINPTNNTFSYAHSSKKTWQGGQGIFNGGRMFAMPYSALSSPPRTPFWEAFLTFITGGLYLIFAGEAATVEQISNEQGHTLIDEQGKLNTEPLTRIKNLFPIVRSAQRRFSDVQKIKNVANRPPLGTVLLKELAQVDMYYVSLGAHGGKMYPDHVLRDFSDRAVLNRAQPESLTIKSRLGKAGAATLKTDTLQRQLPTPVTNSRVSDLLEQAHSASVLSEVLRQRKALNIKVHNRAQGEYEVGFVSGRASIMLKANTTVGTSDVISLASLATAEQALTFQAAELAHDKQLQVTLTSYDRKRTYELSNLKLGANQAFTLQHDNACRSLRLQGLSAAISFDLKLFVDGRATPVMQKAVTLDPEVSVALAPVDWDQLSVGAANNHDLQLKVFNPADGVLLRTQLL